MEKIARKYQSNETNFPIYIDLEVQVNSPKYFYNTTKKLKICWETFYILLKNNIDINPFLENISKDQKRRLMGEFKRANLWFGPEMGKYNGNFKIMEYHEPTSNQIFALEIVDIYVVGEDGKKHDFKLEPKEIEEILIGVESANKGIDLTCCK